MAFKIYIAGAYADQVRVARCFEMVRGTAEYNGVPVDLELAHDWLKLIGDNEPEWEMPKKKRRDHARADIHRMETADVMWFCAPERGGRGSWFELGCAWKGGMPIVGSGPGMKGSIFCEMIDDDCQFPTDWLAFTHLCKLAREAAR